MYVLPRLQYTTSIRRSVILRKGGIYIGSLLLSITAGPGTYSGHVAVALACPTWQLQDIMSHRSTDYAACSIGAECSAAGSFHCGSNTSM